MTDDNKVVSFPPPASSHSKPRKVRKPRSAIGGNHRALDEDERGERQCPIEAALQSGNRKCCNAGHEERPDDRVDDLDGPKGRVTISESHFISAITRPGATPQPGPYFFRPLSIRCLMPVSPNSFRRAPRVMSLRRPRSTP